MSDQITSYIRTFVPIVIGAVVSYFATKGFNVPLDLQVAATAFLTVLISTVYYIIVRKLESKYPNLGILLGVPSAPTYPPKS